MPPGAPLHFLVGLRRRYVAWTGDPFFAPSSAVHGAPWFEVFLYIEGLVQFPLAAYLVSKLASGRRLAGPAELAGLAFGCLTFMGSAACCYELLHMGADQVAADKKAQLLYGTYLPFVIIRKLPLFSACWTWLRHNADELSKKRLFWRWTCFCDCCLVCRPRVSRTRMNKCVILASKKPNNI